MLTELEISNFRCFRKIRLSSLPRFNVIVGDNSSGKTALLEALFLMGGSSPELSHRNSYWRGIADQRIEFTRSTFKDLWKDLFYGLESDSRISISGIEAQAKKNRKLEIYFESKSSAKVTRYAGDLEASEIIQPINFEWTLGKLNSHLITMDIDEKNELRIVGKTPGSPVVFMSAANPHPGDDVKRFDDLFKKKQEKKLEDAIKSLFPEVESLTLGIHLSKNRIFADLAALKERIPIGLYSAGFKKLVSMLLALTANQDGMFLMDEIENGFYYRRLEDVWKYLVDWSGEKQFNNQVFVSTHSLECLRALREVVKSNESQFNLIRVVKEKGTNQSIVRQFPGVQFLDAIESDIEVR